MKTQTLFHLPSNSLSNGWHCLKVVSLRISLCFDLEATICAVNGETIVISDVRLFASLYRLQVIITESVSIQNSNHNQTRWNTLVGLYWVIGEAR